MNPNLVVILQAILISVLISYIVFDKFIKNDANSNYFYTKNQIFYLEALSEKANDKDPNIRLKVLKELKNIYENLLNYKGNTIDQKKLILKELAEFNFQIGSIYNDNNNKVYDLLGKPFDSYNAKILIAENYFIKAIELYSQMNDCGYLKTTKNNFCSSYRQLEKIAKNGIGFEKIINMEINKCFNLC